MDKNDVIGAGQVAGGGYLAYKGLSHGLPRSLGIRTEYHITSKENAELIQKSNNRLLPEYGGKNGWSQKVNSDRFVKNSTGHIHITGAHIKHDAAFAEKLPKVLQPFARTLQRNIQKIMYKTVGNYDFKQLKQKYSESISSRTQKIKIILDILKTNLLNKKTKTFCIPGIDSHFNKNFIPDGDDIALKSTKPVKVYTNRFSAMIAGVKEFGLKGMKENKSRMMVGLGMLTLGVGAGLSFIKKGINNINNKNKS